MEAARHARHFLGLSAREARVLHALSSKTGSSAVQISTVAKVPRTTCYEILEKLRARGLARKQKVGADRALWRRQTTALLKRHIQHSEALLGLAEEAPDKPLSKTIYQAGTLTVDAVYGGHELIKVYKMAYSGYEHERVLLTQLAPAVRALYDKTSPEEIHRINDAAAIHNTILEIVMTEGTKNEYHRIARDDPSWSPNAAQRMVDISVVPDAVFNNSSSELLIFRDNVLLTDWVAETGFILKSRELAHMLKSLFRATAAQGRTFDNPKFLRTLSENVTRYRSRLPRA